MLSFVQRHQGRTPPNPYQLQRRLPSGGSSSAGQVGDPAADLGGQLRACAGCRSRRRRSARRSGPRPCRGGWPSSPCGWTARVPRMPTGTIGSPLFRASRKPPRWNGRRVSVERPGPLGEEQDRGPRPQARDGRGEALPARSAVPAVDRDEAAGRAAPSRRPGCGTGSAWPGTAPAPGTVASSDRDVEQALVVGQEDVARPRLDRRGRSEPRRARRSRRAGSVAQRRATDEHPVAPRRDPAHQDRQDAESRRLPRTRNRLPVKVAQSDRASDGGAGVFSHAPAAGPGSLSPP